MTTRTTSKTVTFSRPFLLSGMDNLLPAGVYRVETDEELIEGLSFSAYRRTLTVIHLLPQSDQPGITRSVTVDPLDLAAAVRRDEASAALRALARSGETAETAETA